MNIRTSNDFIQYNLIKKIGKASFIHWTSLLFFFHLYLYDFNTSCLVIRDVDRFFCIETNFHLTNLSNFFLKKKPSKTKQNKRQLVVSRARSLNNQLTDELCLPFIIIKRGTW